VPREFFEGLKNRLPASAAWTHPVRDSGAPPPRSWALAGLGIAGVAGASALAYADTVKRTVSEVPIVVAPETSIAQAPVTEAQQSPEYTPQRTYEPAPAPATHESTAPSTPPTTRRRNLTPTTVMAPNYSPHVTVSHGS
jgi:hypothetical protein